VERNLHPQNFKKRVGEVKHLAKVTVRGEKLQRENRALVVKGKLVSLKEERNFHKLTGRKVNELLFVINQGKTRR